MSDVSPIAAGRRTPCPLATTPAPESRWTRRAPSSYSGTGGDNLGAPDGREPFDSTMIDLRAAMRRRARYPGITQPDLPIEQTDLALHVGRAGWSSGRSAIRG